MNQIEREIINALELNANVDWNLEDPNKEFLDLIEFVKGLFAEYKKGELWKNTIKSQHHVTTHNVSVS